MGARDQSRARALGGALAMHRRIYAGLGCDTLVHLLLGFTVAMLAATTLVPTNSGPKWLRRRVRSRVSIWSLKQPMLGSEAPRWGNKKRGTVLQSSLGRSGRCHARVFRTGDDDAQ